MPSQPFLSGLDRGIIYATLIGLLVWVLILLVLLTKARNEVEILTSTSNRYMEETIELRAMITLNTIDISTLQNSHKNTLTRVATLEARSDVMETAIDPDKQRQRRIIQARNVMLTVLHNNNNPHPIKKCGAMSPWDVYRVTGWLVDYSERYGVDLSLAMAVARRESLFCQNAVSPAGAVGIMQLMPATAEHLANKIGLQLNRYKAEDNIRMGVYYLGQLMLDFKGNIELAVKAYNTGPDNVRRVLAGEVEDYYKETRFYWQYVEQFQQEFKKAGL